MSESNTEWETMLGYGLDKDGRHNGALKLNSAEDLMSFLSGNVEKFHELMITDLGDNCTMLVVEQALIFPLPEGLSANNKWSARLRRFILETSKAEAAKPYTPSIAYIQSNQRPIYNIVDNERDAYWWGLNCRNMGFTADQTTMSAEQAFETMSQEARDNFWSGFTSGDEQA